MFGVKPTILPNDRHHWQSISISSVELQSFSTSKSRIRRLYFLFIKLKLLTFAVFEHKTWSWNSNGLGRQWIDNCQFGWNIRLCVCVAVWASERVETNDRSFVQCLSVCTICLFKCLNQIKNKHKMTTRISAVTLATWWRIQSKPTGDIWFHCIYCYNITIQVEIN